MECGEQQAQVKKLPQRRREKRRELRFQKINSQDRQDKGKMGQDKTKDTFRVHYNSGLQPIGGKLSNCRRLWRAHGGLDYMDGMDYMDDMDSMDKHG